MTLIGTDIHVGLFIHLITHFIYFYSASSSPLTYYSEALPTTALILCRRYHAEALQATVNEGLAQGLYLAASMGFKPATLPMQGTKNNTEPPLPTMTYD